MKAIECPKVGEIMTAVNGVQYMAIAMPPGAGCSECDLMGSDRYCDRTSLTGLFGMECTRTNRPDMTEVIYRRIETIVEEL